MMAARDELVDFELKANIKENENEATKGSTKAVLDRLNNRSSIRRFWHLESDGQPQDAYSGRT